MAEAIDAVFQLADRQVWIVTAADAARRGGLVATWVSKSSLDPQQPTVSIAIAFNHFTRELIDSGGAFGLHLIAPRHVDLAWRFALGSGRDRDKLDGLEWTAGETGSPQLDDCLARLDCRVYDRHDGGDRIYYWADVASGACLDASPPLTEQGLLALASVEQKRLLRADMQADIELQRPRLAAHRRQAKP